MLPKDMTTLGDTLFALSCYDKTVSQASQAYFDAKLGRGTLTSLDSSRTFPADSSHIIKRGQKYRYDYGQAGSPEHYSFEFVA